MEMDQSDSQATPCEPPTSVLACWVDVGGRELPFGTEVRHAQTGEVVGMVMSSEPGGPGYAQDASKTWVVIQLYPSAAPHALESLYLNLFGLDANAGA
jgi:hypothetical protein